MDGMEALNILARSLGYMCCIINSCLEVSRPDMFEVHFVGKVASETSVLRLSPKSATSMCTGIKIDIQRPKGVYEVVYYGSWLRAYDSVAKSIAKTLYVGGSLVLELKNASKSKFDYDKFKFVDAADSKVSEFMMKATLNGWMP